MAGQGLFFIFILPKTDVGTFFRNSKQYFFISCACSAISSDINQVSPYNLIVKASAHRVDMTSSLMHKTYTVGAQYLTAGL